MPEHRRKGFWRRLAHKTKPYRHLLVIPLLEAARVLAQALPHGWVLALGRALGRLGWWVDRRSRARAERQLRERGMAADRPTARRLSRQVYETLGMNAMEFLHSLNWGPERFHQCVRIQGFEIVERELAAGRGIIFVSAHLGNWELLTRACQAFTGRTVAAVMADQTDAAQNRWLVRQRSTGGNRLLSTQDSALGMMRHLRRGGMLALIADQDSTRGRGLFVDFFGRPAYTPAGPAHLARRAGVAIVPVSIHRQEGDPRRHCIQVDEPLWADPTAEEEADLQRLTQAYTRVLEQRIREHPAQWAWMHHRWNHQPGQKIRIRSAGGKARVSR